MGTLTCQRAQALRTNTGSQRPQVLVAHLKLNLGSGWFLLQSRHWRNSSIPTQTFGVCCDSILANSVGPGNMQQCLYLIIQCRVTPAFSLKVKLQFSKSPSHHKDTEGSKGHLPLYRFTIFVLPKQNQQNKAPRFGPFVNHLTTKVYKFISPFHSFIYPAALKVLTGQ